MDNDRLQQIYDDAGAPGVQSFKFAVRRAGIRISDAEAKEFVAKQAQGQVMQGRLRSDGVVPSGGRDSSRAQADLIDFSKRIKRINSGHKYVLVVVDLYDRQLFTVPMRSKTADETLSAWRKVIQSNGGITFGETTVDQGNEWALLKNEIESKGGQLRYKDLRQPNSIAVADAAVSKLKKILVSYSLTNWADSLKRATLAYNQNSHSALMGSAPDDVKGSAELQYEIEKNNGLQIKHNNDKWRSKVGKLRDAGAFRTPLPRDTWERVDAPKFGGTVHEVVAFKGANVEDEKGDSFPVKTSLAVPSGSADVDTGIESGPGGGRRALQREMLQDFARSLKDAIPSTGNTLARVAQILRFMRGFHDTADVYGPAKAGRIVSFLKLYPNMFEIRGSGPNIKVFEKAPVVPRPVQVGGGSSGVPVERQPRAIEIDRRAPYRRIPNEQRLRYTVENPKRVGTAAYRRYETYKSATDAGMARRLGSTPMDFKIDAEKGYVTLL